MKAHVILAAAGLAAALPAQIGRGQSADPGAAWEQLSEQYDKDGDDAISAAEWNGMYSELPPTPLVIPCNSPSPATRRMPGSSLSMPRATTVFICLQFC